jgi:RNA polymerase sigma-70 factor (ECF subfamily)
MAGDHGAFEELARAAIGRLYAVARLILGDQDRAADATQEALVAAWRDLSALRDPDRFDAWLHRLLLRACYREARRDRRRSLMELHNIAAEPADVDRSSVLFDRDELARGFRTLDPESRALLVLHYYRGLPVSEVATIVDLPEGTVKSRIHRAIRVMRAALDADARLPLMTEGRQA